MKLQKPSKDFGSDSECDQKLLEHLPMSDMIRLMFFTGLHQLLYRIQTEKRQGINYKGGKCNNPAEL